MRNWTSICSLFCLVWGNFACEDKHVHEPDPVVIEKGNMVIVGQEGNYKWGNASLGLINLGKNQTDMQAYKTFNKLDLGDVFQSATFWNDQWWIVVNNSGKIEVLNIGFMKQRTVTGFTSPRYLLPVSTDKAYVTDLYAKGLWVISGSQTQANSKIDMPGWTEEMVLVNGMVYVVCKTNAKVIRIDPAIDQVLDSVLLPGNATSIAKASNNKVWIGFGGKNGSKPGLCLYNPATALAEKTWYSTSVEQIPDRFQATETGDSLFFICGTPCLLKTTDSDFYRYPLGNSNWYGLGYDPTRKLLFASDAKDYLQNSRIVQMDLSGTIQKEWVGGIITSRFYFW